jgi:hypothetical protein
MESTSKKRKADTQVGSGHRPGESEAAPAAEEESVEAIAARMEAKYGDRLTFESDIVSLHCSRLHCVLRLIIQRAAKQPAAGSSSASNTASSVSHFFIIAVSCSYDLT